MVVLDASGSMLADDAGGQVRMDAARDATVHFLDEVGDSMPIGLLT